ncbi:hypothetical protein NHG32_07250 [Aerococcaceae bacterium NML191219]|nr:hypothetical protein [Aerococcaceae bacterium NML191219]
MQVDDIKYILEARHEDVVNEFVSILKFVKENFERFSTDVKDDQELDEILRESDRVAGNSSVDAHLALEGKIKTIIEHISQQQVVRVSYSEIARSVSIELMSSQDMTNEMSHLLERIKDKLGKLLDLYFKKDESLKLKKSPDNDEAFVAFFKMIEHTNLVVVQKIQFYQETAEKVKELESKVSDYEKSLEKSKEEAKSISKNLNKAEQELKNLKDKVMAEIMAIMGIFASIIFAVFGGLQQIGAIGSSLATTPLHKVFIFSGMSALALTYVVFLAFNSTAKLTGKRLRSCNCTNEEECQKKGLFHKHPTLFIMTWLFASTVGIGVIVLIYKKYLDDVDDFLKKGAVVGILGTVFLIGGGIFFPTVLAPLCRKIYTKYQSWKQNRETKKQNLS